MKSTQFYFGATAALFLAMTFPFVSAPRQPELRTSSNLLTDYEIGSCFNSFFPTITFTQQKEKDFTLTDLVKTARVKRSDIQSQDHAICKFMKEESAAFSTFFPQISFAMDVRKSKRDFLPRTHTDIWVKQFIFDQAGPFIQRDIAAQDTATAEAQRALLQDDLTFSVESTFLDYWDSALEKTVQEKRCRKATIVLEKAQKQFDIGLLSEPQWEEEQATYENDIRLVINYSHNFSNRKSDLWASTEQTINQTFNIPTISRYVSTMIAKGETTPAKYFMQASLKNRKELRVLDEEICKAQLERDKYRNTYIPKLSFFINSTSGSIFNTLPSTQKIDLWYTGILLEWTFDGLGNMHRAEEANQKSLEKLLSKKRTEITIQSDVTTTHNDFTSRVEDLKAQMATTKKAESVYEKNKKAFEVGLISEVEFARQLETWQQAQFDLEKARTTTAKKYRELLYKSGYPDNDYE